MDIEQGSVAANAPLDANSARMRIDSSMPAHRPLRSSTLMADREQ
jgi:hypothetical protein